jgi:hypothetical protein
VARKLGPIVPDRTLPRPLYEILRSLSGAQTQTSAAIGAITRGVTPNGGATPLVDTSDLFRLPGRSGGQTACGGTEASGRLVLSSTVNPTKGTIYFGTSLASAYDETNVRLGIGTATPAANLHLLGTTLLKLETSAFSVTCGVTLGNSLITCATGFVPSGGPSVVSGMLVTSPLFPVPTYVRSVLSGTEAILTQVATGTNATATVTFSANAEVGVAATTETGRDLDWTLHGAFRITPGPTATPLRILNDYLKTNAPGFSVANCSATGTYTITTSSSFTNVATGNYVTGGTVPAGTIVNTVVGSTLTVSNIIPTMTNQTLTFINAQDTICLEAGYVSGGTATGTNLQLGGPNRGELAHLRINAKTTWFTRPDVLGTTVCLAVGSDNPAWYNTGLGPPACALFGAGASRPVTIVNSAANTDSLLQILPISTGTIPTKTLDTTNFLFKWTGDGKAYIANGAGSYYYLSAPSGAFAVCDSTNLQVIGASKVASWSDGVSSHYLQLGDLIASTNRYAWISSSGYGVLHRFGVSSAYYLVSNGQAGGANFPAPEGSSASLLRVYNAATGGADDRVLLKLQTARAGQSGDLLQCTGSGGTLSGFTSTGAYYLLASKGTGKVLVSDANGVGSWTPSTGLTTRVVYRWAGNGPFTIDTAVDGGMVVTTACNITGVRLYRRVAGSSGTTTVDLNQNGTTLYTTQGNRPSIAYNDADGLVTASLPDVVALSAGDLLTIDIDAVEAGTPLDIAVVVEVA